jgi:hypothetical protein
MHSSGRNSYDRSRVSPRGADYSWPGYHASDCPKRGKIARPADGDGHDDLFCSCHAFEVPVPVGDGNAIAWPAGWTVEQAARWREWRGVRHLFAREH